MTVDYAISSLPALVFGQPPALSRAAFDAVCASVPGFDPASPGGAKWRDIETQLRNAAAEARGGSKFKRRAVGCSLYWKQRILACFQEKDPGKRDEMIDRAWWDAAEELADPASPLGPGALAAYAVRYAIAEKRARISAEAGREAFDKLVCGQEGPK